VRSSSSGLRDNSVVQEFIYPKGKKVSVTRFVYHTKHFKKSQANYAYKMRNVLLLEPSAKDSEKITIREKASIVSENEWSFEITKITGTSLSYHENAAKNLTDFLERAYPIRIDKIVLDFITG
jgi:hypothetical protein